MIQNVPPDGPQPYTPEELEQAEALLDQLAPLIVPRLRAALEVIQRLPNDAHCGSCFYCRQMSSGETICACEPPTIIDTYPRGVFPKVNEGNICRHWQPKELG